MAPTVGPDDPASDPSLPPSKLPPAGSLAAWTSLLDLVRAALPGERIQPDRVIEHGWDHQVLLARRNEQPWVFRLSRRDELGTDLDRERQVLALVGQRLPVAVPQWLFERRLGKRLMVGYPAVPGRPAGEEPHGHGVFRIDLPAPVPDSFVETLAAALAALHAVPASQVTAAIGPPPPPHRWADRMTADLTGLQQRSDLAPGLASFWRDWLASEQARPPRQVLVHSDVHPGHTFVEDDGRVVGLIDWTDAGWGDPAQDFVDARHAFGGDVADRLLTAYASAGGLVDPSFSERVVARQSLGALGAAVFGMKTGQSRHVDAALTRMQLQADRVAHGLPPV